jgi:hypothetical protein
LELSGFEIYLLQEALKHYKDLLGKEEFPQNSIVTKKYVDMTIAQIEAELSHALEW